MFSLLFDLLLLHLKHDQIMEDFSKTRLMRMFISLYDIIVVLHPSSLTYSRNVCSFNFAFKLIILNPADPFENFYQIMKNPNLKSILRKHLFSSVWERFWGFKYRIAPSNFRINHIAQTNIIQISFVKFQWHLIILF